MLKLLISPTDEQEALEAVAGGADIIDVKNPKEGPLGASFPWIIRQIGEAIPKTVELSCTLGDLPNLPGTAALAALGAASLGVSYVKAGLYAIKTQQEAVELMKAVTKAAKSYSASVKVVCAGYADADRVGSINPLLLPKIAKVAGCDVAMLDTAVKDGKTLFDFLSPANLKAFVDEAHECELQAALAGSLRLEHLPQLRPLGVDVIGIRGAACTNGDRVTGRVAKEKVRAIAEVLSNAQKPCRAADS